MFIILLSIFNPYSTLEKTSSANKPDQGYITGSSSIQPVKFSIDNLDTFTNLFISRIVINRYFDILYYHQTPSTSDLTKESILNLNQILEPTDKILDFNFFYSNSYFFGAVSFEHENVSYLTFLKFQDQIVLENYTLQSSANYNISYINTFENSSDVYFSVYNDHSFSIIKFDFNNSQFFNYFSTSFNQTDSIKITDVNVFKLDNKLYCSILSKGSALSSKVVILNDAGIILDRLFSNIEISTFTSSPIGLIFYSKMTNVFYNYVYQTDSMSGLSLGISNYHNLSTFKPFDNNSFLVLGPNIISVYNITGSTNSLIINNEKTYIITDPNDTSDHTRVEAFVVQSQKWYMYKGIANSNEFVISTYNIDKAPYDFIPLNPDTNFFTTTDSTSNINSNLIDPILFILILILISVFLSYLLISKQRNKNLNKNVVYEANNLKIHSSPQQNQSNREISIVKTNLGSHCRNCGEKTEHNDLFCMYCGNQLI